MRSSRRRSKQHDWSLATKNRYKNVFGRAFKIAFSDGKVSGNQARLVEQRSEKNARIRFLSNDEEMSARDVIAKRCPHHMEFGCFPRHAGDHLQDGAMMNVYPDGFRLFWKADRLHLDLVLAEIITPGASAIVCCLPVLELVVRNVICRHA